MKSLLTALATSMFISMGCSAKEVVFYIGQEHNDWAFNVVGKGKAVVGDTLAYSEHEYIKYTNNPKHNKTKTVKYVSVGYAYSIPDGGWNVKPGGARQEINRTLKPGEWMTSHWIDSKLKFEGRPAENYWIVVTIATDTGLVYAHSRRDIFK